MLHRLLTHIRHRRLIAGLRDFEGKGNPCFLVLTPETLARQNVCTWLRGVLQEGAQKGREIKLVAAESMHWEGREVMSVMQVALAVRFDKLSPAHIVACDFYAQRAAWILHYLLPAQICRISWTDDEELANKNEESRKIFICAQTREHASLSSEEDFLSEQESFEQRRECKEIQPRLSIIVPVYNALAATLRCLEKLKRVLPEGDQVLVVDDASEKTLGQKLEAFCADQEQFRYFRHEVNQGFVAACQTGLHHARADDDILLVNSDVVLAQNTIRLMKQAMSAHPLHFIGSPLSTASPHFQFDLRAGQSLDEAAALLEHIRKPSYPMAVTPEGQCFYIKRECIKKFGFFDPVYGRGYGEESDLSMRVLTSGYRTICVDNALVFHERSASFGKQEREAQIAKNRVIFEERWGPYVKAAQIKFYTENPIHEIRSAYAQALPQYKKPGQHFRLERYQGRFAKKAEAPKHISRSLPLLGDAQVVFILPSVLQGGGSLSVLQHAQEMLQRGIRCKIISLTALRTAEYPLTSDILEIAPEELFSLDWSSQHLIATFWMTAYYVKYLKEKFPKLRPYYYVQGYEPFLYPGRFRRRYAEEAAGTYSFGLPSVVKTQYLEKMLREKHGVQVTHIRPGIDQAIFYPGVQTYHTGTFRIAAMYRPEGKERAPEFLLDLVEQCLFKNQDWQFTLFGGEHRAFAKKYAQVRFIQHLSQSKVAELYRCSHVVLDGSHWQSFGRMGIEGMCCGAVPVLSDSGGIHEYARHEKNALIFPRGDAQAALASLCAIASDPVLFQRLRNQGLQDAQEFSEKKACDDWLALLGL